MTTDYLTLNVTINNIPINSDSIVDDPIRITNEVIISWDFYGIPISDINESDGTISQTDLSIQKSFELIISDDISNLGTHNFTGNIVNENVESEEQYWILDISKIERGEIYYGQIKVEDEYDNETSYYIFSFKYNSIPEVEYVSLLPIDPKTTDDLNLDYSFYDPDGDLEQGTFIRWFKNGIYQPLFDNKIFIPSEETDVGDVWVSDVLPKDGYEYGIRYTSNSIKVEKETILLESIRVLPSNPNENDILKADFRSDSGLVYDNVKIKWFINDSLIPYFNDKKHIRPVVDIGDRVRYEVKPINGSFYYESEEVIIQESPFVINNVLIDGRKNPLDVQTTTPVLRWNAYSPKGKDIKFIHIKIGTFYNADNIYSNVIEYNRNNWQIPPSILEKGNDYYISIAASDDNNFSNYTYEHFRLDGSRWSNNVNNNNGWTIETLFYIPIQENNNNYQILKIQDGSRYAEIRIYYDHLSFFSNKVINSEILNFNKYNSLTVTGKNNNIKIYFNRELLIDATGLFTQGSSLKRLEIGNNTGEFFEIDYKYFHYTTSGSFHPNTADEFSDYQFYKYIYFGNSDIISLKGLLKHYDSYAQDQKVFAVNPHDKKQGSKIYSIVPLNPYRVGTDNAIFNPIEGNIYHIITQARISSNSKIKVFSHGDGISIIEGHHISSFDFEAIFDEQDNEVIKKWQRIQNINNEDVSYVDNNGLNINTFLNS